MTDNPFGRVLTAMVTPMRPDGSLDEPGIRSLVDHLLGSGHDGLVVNGTTGESATLSSDESIQVLDIVVDQVDGRAGVTMGVGSNDTAHAVAMAKRAEQAGATGALLVTPYYNKPTQPGIIAHTRAVADATDLPVMLYDIPGRTAMPLATDTILALAEHPKVRAVKDAKSQLWESTKIMAATDLLWFSGNDEENLIHLALGATGVVSVVGHVAGKEYAAMVEAMDRGDLGTAREIHRRLIPLHEAMMMTSQGAIMAKAALVELGVIESAAVRLPLVESPPEHLERLRDGLRRSGLARSGAQ